MPVCTKSMKLKQKWYRTTTKMKFILGYNMKSLVKESTGGGGGFQGRGGINKFLASGGTPPSLSVDKTLQGVV